MHEISSYICHAYADKLHGFKKAFSSGRMHHAWILAGPEGVGKREFAAHLTEYLLNFTLAGERENSARDLLEARAHPDFRLITRLPKKAEDTEDTPSIFKRPSYTMNQLKRSIDVAQIRALAPMLNNAPSLSKNRVILIDSADYLERASGNALLKSLEEPPPGTYFFLLSHRADKLLATVRSRCQIMQFPRWGDTQMLDFIGFYLKNIRPVNGAGSENSTAIDEQTLLGIAGGRPLVCQRFVENHWLDIATILGNLLASGDQDGTNRAQIMKKLGQVRAGDLFELFLTEAPNMVADYARTNPDHLSPDFFDRWTKINNIINDAHKLSLGPDMVAFRVIENMANMTANRPSRR